MADYSNRYEVTTALISFICSIAMIAVFGTAVQYIVNDWYCVYKFVRKDHCKLNIFYYYYYYYYYYYFFNVLNTELWTGRNKVFVFE